MTLRRGETTADLSRITSKYHQITDATQIEDSKDIIYNRLNCSCTLHTDSRYIIIPIFSIQFMYLQPNTLSNIHIYIGFQELKIKKFVGEPHPHYLSRPVFPEYKAQVYLVLIVHL